MILKLIGKCTGRIFKLLYVRNAKTGSATITVTKQTTIT